jgi:hypothetical protein
MTKPTDDTAQGKPGPHDAIEGDRHAAFVAEAMMLRTLHAYRAARNQAKFYVHSDMADYFKPPSYDKLRLKYEDLMHEWSAEQPDGPHGVLAYLELVSAIIAGWLTSRYEDEGGILSAERDFGYALELLARARRWVNKADIHEAVAAERAFKAAKDGEVQP